jgi:hypothetical protein
LRFHVHSLGAAQLRATDAAQRVVFDGRLGADRRLNLTGQPPFTLETANGEDLEVFYLGQRKRFGPAAGGKATLRFGDPPATP